MKGRNISYLPGVDHLRGFAALLIVLYHGHQVYLHRFLHGAGEFGFSEWPTAATPMGALIDEGHSAVALFMVLSGFIFTYGTFGKEISYGRFIGNRVRRIFPMFVLVTFVAIASKPGAYSFLALIQTLALQGNERGGLAILPYTGMHWAIDVEFQFYLLFPFLIRFTRQRGIGYLLGVLLTFALMRVLALLGGTTNARDLTYVTIFGRMDQFVFGMLAAIAYRRSATLPAVQRLLRWMVLPALGLMSIALYSYNHHGGHPSLGAWKVWWISLEGALWALFVVTYLCLSPLLPDWLSRAVARYGEVSFSLYLLHYPVIHYLVQNDLVWKASPDAYLSSALNIACIAVPATFAAASLTYLIIEKSFLDMRQTYVHDVAGSTDAPLRELAAVTPPAPGRTGTWDRG